MPADGEGGDDGRAGTGPSRGRRGPGTGAPRAPAPGGGGRRGADGGRVPGRGRGAWRRDRLPPRSEQSAAAAAALRPRARLGPRPARLRQGAQGLQHSLQPQAPRGRGPGQGRCRRAGGHGMGEQVRCEPAGTLGRPQLRGLLDDGHRRRRRPQQAAPGQAQRQRQTGAGRRRRRADSHVREAGQEGPDGAGRVLPNRWSQRPRPRRWHGIRLPEARPHLRRDQVPDHRDPGREAARGGRELEPRPAVGLPGWRRWQLRDRHRLHLQDPPGHRRGLLLRELALGPSGRGARCLAEADR